MKHGLLFLGIGLLASGIVWAAEPDRKEELLNAHNALARDPPALTKDQVAFVWTLLERNARNSADASFLLYTLYGEPGDLLDQGWAKFGHGEQWLDWWLVLRPKPRRPLGGNDYFTFIECCETSEVRAVAERPNILDRIVLGRLYHLGLGTNSVPREKPITFGEIKEAWLDWKLLSDLERQSDDHPTSYEGYYAPDVRRVHYWSHHVNRLRWCYWLFGRGDEARNVTNYTWKRDYLAFRKWLTENESYLRFQKKEYQYVVDHEAKRTRRPVPANARCIASPASPFPDWKGSPPGAYDYDLGI